jgi:hypothetical protein
MVRGSHVMRYAALALALLAVMPPAVSRASTSDLNEFGGYVFFMPSFGRESVQTRMIVPTVDCTTVPAGTGSATLGAGIETQYFGRGGYAALIQLTCTNGAASYEAFSAVDYTLSPLAVTIAAGDRVRLSVTADPSSPAPEGAWMTIDNLTTQGTATATAPQLTQPIVDARVAVLASSSENATIPSFGRLIWYKTRINDSYAASRFRNSAFPLLRTVTPNRKIIDIGPLSPSGMSFRTSWLRP